MEQWSILSNMVNYIKYDRHLKNFYNLNIRAVNKEKNKGKSNLEEERQMLELDFGDMQEKLNEEYLHICHSCRNWAMKFNLAVHVRMYGGVSQGHLQMHL